MGRRGKDDGPTGVLVVDKPAGMTSHDVVAVVRRAAGTRRVGHTGTLDPDATGVLVCCLGRATRLVRFLQASEKTYHATMVLGRATSTQDAAGETTFEGDASGITEARFCKALMDLRGDQLQIPPMVSALKVDGERLHEKARRGEVVEREPRPITVHDLVLEHFEPGALATATFLVTCSPGTYVRTLAHDVGERLGVGGSLTGLRRLANGSFTTSEAMPLDDVTRHGEQGTLVAELLDPTTAMRGLPQIEVDDERVRTLVNGGRLPEQGITGPYCAVHAGRLVGVYEDRDGSGRPEVVLLRPEDLTGPTDVVPSAAPADQGAVTADQDA
jgi:tRNA pseudouridine55 synthase